MIKKSHEHLLVAVENQCSESEEFNMSCVKWV